MAAILSPPQSVKESVNQKPFALFHPISSLYNHDFIWIIKQVIFHLHIQDLDEIPNQHTEITMVKIPAYLNKLYWYQENWPVEYICMSQQNSINGHCPLYINISL